MNQSSINERCFCIADSRSKILRDAKTMYSNWLRKAIESYGDLSRYGLNSLDILDRIFDIKLFKIKGEGLGRGGVLMDCCSSEDS